MLFYLAALLLLLIGAAHSYLGERYILTRLFRRDNLPKLFGDTTFTKNTLRFAWHLTTVAWLGFALILIHLANPPLEKATVGNIIGGVFLIHFAIALIASKGKHLSWIFFLAIGLLAIYAANS